MFQTVKLRLSLSRDLQLLCILGYLSLSVTPLSLPASFKGLIGEETLKQNEISYTRLGTNFNSRSFARWTKLLKPGKLVSMTTFTFFSRSIIIGDNDEKVDIVKHQVRIEIFVYHHRDFLFCQCLPIIVFGMRNPLSTTNAWLMICHFLDKTDDDCHSFFFWCL